MRRSSDGAFDPIRSSFNSRLTSGFFIGERRMKTNQQGFTSVELLVAIFGVLGLAGWISNIVQLVGAGPLGSWGGVEILKVIGIFLAPLGSVMGVIGWF